MELLLGCGFLRDKRIFPTAEREWDHLVTLDYNKKCDPDVEFDLNELAIHYQHLPFSDNYFDEIHAYEVLEHLGKQGESYKFFREFNEYWRILKPNGYFCATVPHWQSLWAWGDPSHVRIINAGTLMFLSQKECVKQIGTTSMSDFRSDLGSTNFDIMRARTRGETFEFILQAVK